MKPASAMSFALKKPGRLAVVCACTRPDFVAATVIAARATERRRARFVNISNTPHADCQHERPTKRINIGQEYGVGSVRLCKNGKMPPNSNGCSQGDHGIDE